VPFDPSKSDSSITRPDSGIFRAMQPSPESVELQDVVSRMFLTQDAGELVKILSEAAMKYTKARSISVFLRNDDGAFIGGDPAQLPEKTVMDYVLEEARPITVPHGKGWITAFPLRVAQGPVGLLVCDVTDLAEEIVRMNLEPVSVLCGQAAVMIHNAQRVNRSIGESALLSNILDSITNAIITIDNDGRITRLNRNAMAILELTPDVVGQPYGSVLFPDVANAVTTLLKETEHMGFAMEKMVTARLAQGLELNIAVSTSILRDESFAPLGTIVVFRDMTASRELDRLRKLDMMKSEFVANVSHELKTPLTSIKAYTEALLDMATEEQMKAFLKVIDEESDRLLFLINDLLNVSRIQSGKIKMRFTLIQPRAIVDEILSISKVHSEKHKLVLEIAEGLPEMMLDKEKLKEVMINLISNAIKYSPAGGDVNLRMRMDETNLRIEIQDHGIGIAKAHQSKLFEAFYRVDSSHTAAIPGTGLGLTIVKAIIEHHGGRTWFESEVGKGTTFFLLIPSRREIRRGELGSEIGSMAEGG
jgi:PAS domain S-box-containing protein